MKKVLMLLLCLILSITITGCKSEEKEAGSDNEVKVDYEVVGKEDLPTAAAKRYSWDVVVNEKLNKDELKNLAKNIIEEAKEKKSFNAISIGFYDYEEYVGTGYTLGKVDYAPEGDWGKASTVKTGEYEKMDYNFSLMEKDWDKQLTKEEVEIYKSWHDLFKEKDTESNLPDEDEVGQEVAEIFNITKDEVDSIMMKQVTWAFDDNK